jgi:hypothetical protein
MLRGIFISNKRVLLTSVNEMESYCSFTINEFLWLPLQQQKVQYGLFLTLACKLGHIYKQ